MAVSAREIASGKGMPVNLGIAYSAIWLVDTLIPLHNSTMRPVNAIETRNLVRVKKSRTALHGGRRALADFHVTPPLGKSILFLTRRPSERWQKRMRCRCLGDEVFCGNYARAVVIERV